MTNIEKMAIKIHGEWGTLYRWTGKCADCGKPVSCTADRVSEAPTCTVVCEDCLEVRSGDLDDYT